MKRALLAVAALALVAGVGGCGDDDTVYVQAPPAYGQAGQCYYVDDPDEVVQLQQAGLCPVNWVPVLMPVPWRSQYAWYYDSPSYYDRYVRADRRKTYVTHVTVYQRSHPQAVRTPPRATTPKPSGSFRSGTGLEHHDGWLVAVMPL